MSEGLRAARRKVGGFQEIETPHAGRDIKHVAAFGHYQFIEKDVAARDAIQDVGWRVGASELIFAGLQLPV